MKSAYCWYVIISSNIFPSLFCFCLERSKTYWFYWGFSFFCCKSLFLPYTHIYFDFVHDLPLSCQYWSFNVLVLYNWNIPMPFLLFWTVTWIYCHKSLFIASPACYIHCLRKVVLVLCQYSVSCWNSPILMFRQTAQTYTLTFLF